MSDTRTLYGFWISPYMATVAQYLMESDLSFDYERVSPYAGETVSDSHKQRNPLGKIPSLKEPEGEVISESLAICRYLSRKYPQAHQFYPCHDAEKCAPIDIKSDFITFSIAGPFFNAFVFGAYFPQAFGFRMEQEAALFAASSVFLIKGAMGRLMHAAHLTPYLSGDQPNMADFQLFQMLQLGKTFEGYFTMPMLNLLHGDEKLQTFFDAMSERESSQKVLAFQEQEMALTKTEIFEKFGPAYSKVLERAKDILPKFFGHEV